MRAWPPRLMADSTSYSSFSYNKLQEWCRTRLSALNDSCCTSVFRCFIKNKLKIRIHQWTESLARFPLNKGNVLSFLKKGDYVTFVPIPAYTSLKESNQQIKDKLSYSQLAPTNDHYLSFIWLDVYSYSPWRRQTRMDPPCRHVEWNGHIIGVRQWWNRIRSI